MLTELSIVKYARPLVIAAALCATGLALAQISHKRDPFEVPVTRYGDWGEWDPERELTFRFENWWLGDTVTGRYAVFSFPIGHTSSGGSGSPDRESTSVAHLQHRLVTADDGSMSFLPQATREEEWRWSTRVPPNLASSLVSNTTPSDQSLRSILRRAKAFNGPFPGYTEDVRSFGQHNEDYIYYVGTHCGFDMFESIALRGWQILPDGTVDFEASAPSEVAYPFDRARVFGWPDANGVTYAHGIVCRHNRSCVINKPIRSWMGITVFLDPVWLCEVPDMIPAYIDWLDTRVIEEETEILNPEFS